mmetsp:Transcript_6785/g.18661  ORF Transcript_6785/g.18661 Transcript_6785/m.18661 type:complete len:132 (-) Transcript_6785:191-586(-)
MTIGNIATVPLAVGTYARKNGPASLWSWARIVAGRARNHISIQHDELEGRQDLCTDSLFWVACALGAATEGKTKLQGDLCVGHGLLQFCRFALSLVEPTKNDDDDARRFNLIWKHHHATQLVGQLDSAGAG